MGFKESKNFSLNSIAKEIEDFWAKNDVFIKSSNRNNRENFVFFEGPPSANGKPGIHHVMARTIKTLFVDIRLSKDLTLREKLDGTPMDFLLN